MPIYRGGSFYQTLFTASLFTVLVSFATDGFCQSQPPINIIFDMHADPIPQAPYPGKVQYYEMQLENGNWVLDQAEPFGAKISFLACGEFMEFVVQDGPGGSGADFLQRIYASGEQIGSHSHSEYRRGAFDWPSYQSPASYEESMQSWQDNIDLVNAAILTALGSPPPRPLSEINAVKGAHLPETEEEYHSLMTFFGLEVREGGAEEDYYGIYNHYIMNPFRPATDNYMGEDLDAPFVAIPQGAVIGKAGIHHNVYQDMTAPNVKRLFIQTYLNWRYRDRHGLTDRVWSFGWGSHNHDYDPGSQSRSDMVSMIQWLDDNFIGKTDATGSVIADWNTQAGTADEYFSWEASHPDESSFDSNGSYLDWDDYPYLRSVCTELWQTHHVADLDLGGGITAWHLRKAASDIVVAFSDIGPVTVDLTSLIDSPCRVVAAETGYPAGFDPEEVTLDSEPVIVTEIAPTVSYTGTPAIGETVYVTIHGDPNASGMMYRSLSSDEIDIPYIGRILIDPYDHLTLLGSGPMSGGSFTQAVTIPDEPYLVGRTIYIQGLEVRSNGSTLTTNALRVMIQNSDKPLLDQ